MIESLDLVCVFVLGVMKEVQKVGEATECLGEFQEGFCYSRRICVLSGDFERLHLCSRFQSPLLSDDFLHFKSFFVDPLDEFTVESCEDRRLTFLAGR
jgi:hypothetical protein